MAYKFQSGEAVLSGNLKQEGTISGSGDVTLAVGKDFNIAGSNVLNLTTLGSSVVGSSLTSVGTLTGLTASSPISANGGLEAGYATIDGVISGSGDLRLGAGKGIDIGGAANVLQAASLGSTVLASSLTSVGTLAGVTASSPFVGPMKPTAFSGSVGVSGSSAKFSGIVNAGRFVGSGAGLTNVTTTTTNVTSSTGDISYELAFTEYLGTGVGLGGNAGLAFNPNGLTSAFSSSLILSGTDNGFQMSRILFGGKTIGQIAVEEDDGVKLKIMFPGGGIDISGSTESGVAIYGGDASGAGVWIRGDQGLTLTNAAEATKATIDKDGNISGSGDLRLGAGSGIDIGGQANVLSQATLGSTVLASSLTSVGTLVGVTSSQPIVASAGLKAAANLSGSSTLQIAGAASFNSTVAAKGAISNDGGSISAAGIISGSGDLTLGVGSDVNIAGSNVLNLTTLGSTVVNSSLTSVGTLVGVTSSQPIVASAGLRTAQDLSASGEIQAAGAAELNSTLSVNGAITLAGASDTAIAVGSDSIYFRDGDGTMKRDTIADLVSAMAGTGLAASSGQLSVSAVGTPNGIGDEAANLAEGLNFGTNTLTANRTWTLPASSGLTAGDCVRVKAPADVSTYYIKVTGSGAQKIDAGNPLLYLESDAAGLSLFYVATNKFVIL